MSWPDDYDLGDLFPGWFGDDDGIFPVDLCEGGCGFPRSFCNCGAAWPVGAGR